MTDVRPEGDVPPLYLRTAQGARRLSRPSYTIGRNPGADIVAGDVRVSWEHAVLHVAGGTWVLEDRGSRYGTWLGGERVTRVEITGPCLVRLADPVDGQHIRLDTSPD
jgi:pSer/pThr/pTyr-binding forkhead associated (FHA) protein